MLKLSLSLTIFLFIFSSIDISASCPETFVTGNLTGVLSDRRPKDFDKEIFLPKDVIIKVSLANSVGTDKYKTGDIVQFEVLDDVFGVTMPEKKPNDWEKKLQNANELTEFFKDQHLQVVIPKKSTGFGRVARVKNRVPFINFKADIRIVLDYIMLDSGECVSVELTRVKDPRIITTPKKDYPRTLGPCKNKSFSQDELCIKGKRPPYNVASVITTLIAGGLIGIFENTTTDILAGSVVLSETTKNDSISDLINGLQATADKEFIYEVKTSEHKVVHVEKDNNPVPLKETKPDP